MNEKKLFFYVQNYYKALLNHLPPGRIYELAPKAKDTTFSFLLGTFAKVLARLNQDYNTRFKGLYLKLSNYFLEEYKKEYSIPNQIFTNDSDTYLDNIRDVFILKYLARDNTSLGLQKIANAYGVRVGFIRKRDFLKASGELDQDDNTYDMEIDNTVIVKLYSGIGDRYYKTATDQGIKLPFFYGKNPRFQKIRSLFNLLKPLHLKFDYIFGTNEEIDNYKFDPNEPDFISFTINNEQVEKIIFNVV